MLSEFGFINNIKKKYSLSRVGDDCAVLPKDDKTDMVVTADLLVEDIDFRLEWTLPELLGHKALAVSLSDIAAMGATPKWAMLSIGVPENLWKEDFIGSFYEGWHKLAGEFDVELVGGDISKAPDRLVIDSIVIGEVPIGRAILRSGAKAGNALVATGNFGGSAGGLMLLKNGDRLDENKLSWKKELVFKQLKPQPQIQNALFLQTRDIANSMIDVSDGFSSDLKHICDMNSVGARIFGQRFPIDCNLQNLVQDSDEMLDLAINGGEDFELLFTIDPEKLSLLNEQVFTHVGEITENVGVIEFVDSGEKKIIEPKGYRHF